MTIANGDTITSTDLNALTTGAFKMGALQQANAQLPGGMQFSKTIPGLVASTSLVRRRWQFVTPCDFLVEAIAVEAADHTAASTTTVTITGDGALSSWPITVSGTTGAGMTKLARLLFDNTKTNQALDFATTSRAFRVWSRGSTLTVTFLTTSVAVASPAQRPLTGSYTGCC